MLAIPPVAAADAGGWEQPRTPSVPVSSGYLPREEARGRLGRPRSSDRTGGVEVIGQNIGHVCTPDAANRLPPSHQPHAYILLVLAPRARLGTPTHDTPLSARTPRNLASEGVHLAGTEGRTTRSQAREDVHLPAILRLPPARGERKTNAHVNPGHPEGGPDKMMPVRGHSTYPDKVLGGPLPGPPWLPSSLRWRDPGRLGPPA